MKIILYSATVLVFSMICFACNREKSVEEQMDVKTTVCYIAVAERDTAWLRIDTAGTQFLGVFELNNSKQKRRHVGPVKGVVRGDTLKGHFDFKVNGVDKWYRNPIAFLKRDGKLIMGVVATNMVWGSAYFDEKVPIDFARGKFVFDEGICK